MDNYSVVLANDLVVKAINFGGIPNIRFNREGKVVSFVYAGQKYIALFEFKSNSFMDYCEENSFDRLKQKEVDKEGDKYDGVKENLWESFKFKNYNDLISAEYGDTIFGLLRDSSGLCYNYHIWSYSNPYLGPINPQLAPNAFPEGQLCDIFQQGSAAKSFFDTYKNQAFYDTNQADIRLVGEIASLLKNVGEKTALAFQNFVLTGVDTINFNFIIGQNGYSRNDFLEYKRGLELWLKMLKKYQVEISKLGDEEKLFISIDVMYRHNMLTLLTVQQRINILKVLVEKKALMNWYWVNFSIGFVHKEDLALYILKSVDNIADATAFLDKLISTSVIKSEYKDNQGVIYGTSYVTLYKMLFYRMDDYGGKDNFTEFASELNRMVLLKNGIVQSSSGLLINNPEQLKPENNFVKYNFIWNKRNNKEFKGEIDYSITYPSSSTLKIKEKICREVSYAAAHGVAYEYASKFYENEIVLNHFDLVSISYLTNPSFLDLCEYGNCQNQTFITYAGFIDYLLEKQDTKFVLETFSTTIQVLSLAFGVGELLIAIRTANLIRGIIGIYTIASDIYAYTISTLSFMEYLQEAYPDNWQDYKNTLDMIALLNGLTNAGVGIGYSAYNVSQANRFIGEVEALQWNPGAMERLSAAEVNALQKTREKLLAEMYILRQNAATNEIIENEIRFWRNYRNLNIPNSRRGTLQEWTLAKQRILNVRQQLNISSDRNFGFIDGVISGHPNIMDDLIDPATNLKTWRSLQTTNANDALIISNEAENINVFQSLNVSGWRRNIDSEFRMINHIIRKIKPNAQVGDVFDDVTGEIIIVSERPYCLSCSTIVKMFNDMFPNINITLIDGTRVGY